MKNDNGASKYNLNIANQDRDSNLVNTNNKNNNLNVLYNASTKSNTELINAESIPNGNSNNLGSNKNTKNEPNLPSYEFHINNNSQNKHRKFKNNRIETTKYSIITFLPKALLFQFMRLANIYFLIIAIIQCFPEISPLSPSTAIAPIAFVLCVSLIREGLEDLARYKYDKTANNEKVKVYRNGKWIETLSKSLEIGEIIVISEEKTFPADLILLDSNAKEGICYIETATLDGEKTLKFKKANHKVSEIFKSLKDSTKYTNHFELSGYCICDRPSENLFQLNGSLKIDYQNVENDAKYNQIVEENGNLIRINSKNINNFHENPRDGYKNNLENRKTNFLTEMETLNLKNNYNSNQDNAAEQQPNTNSTPEIPIQLVGESFPLDPKQLLLKGAILKNTEWIIGLVVYTGHNTKLMKNTKKSKVKYSSVERLMSKFLIAVLVLQSVFCIICAVLYGFYYTANIIYNPFLNIFAGKYLIVDQILNYFTYLLLLNTMIPISLIITLEITKIIQGYFISMDVKLFSKVRKKFCKAGSVSLNEELGQVDYIFSDKTGTLTCNKMKFKFCVIADVCYEFLRREEMNKLDSQKAYQLSKKEKEEIEKEKLFREENDIKIINENHLVNLRNQLTNSENGSHKNLLHKSSYPNFILKSSEGYGTPISLALDNNFKIEEEFFKALALNNECVVSDKKGFNEYSGLNPDDIELVTASKLIGCELLKSESTRQKNLNLYYNSKTFEILNTIEFTSARKKSSIFVREDNYIKMYIKGADSEMLSIISNNSPAEFTVQAKNFVDLFSKQGYRTLIVGMRIFTEEEYKILMEELKEVRQSAAENKEFLLEAVEKMIEKDIYCLGATIVEDKLQDFVPETIRDLRLAGIKIWMLTGDKIDTAENIGKSCNLISEELKIFKVTNEQGFTFKDFFSKFEEYLNKYNVTLDDYRIANKSSSPKKLPEYSLMIDLKQTTADFKNKEYRREIIKISKFAKSVICSRCSPNQKSEVVNMIRNSDSNLVTLSIGDGGNDVPMITEAHIGIGVYGEEGVMAVQSSDFAIGEFQFLRRLLLFHGRTNYIRISEMILYFFFKNFVFTITHFYFGFFNNFSGQTIIDDWFISLYNMIFTAFPLGARAVADHDIHPMDGKGAVLFQPFLYEEGKRNPAFNIRNFCLELLRGMVHGIINYIILYFVLLNTPVDSDGNIADMWFFSVNCYTNIISIVSLNLIIKSRYITFLNFLTMLILSWFLYFAFVLFVHFSTMFNSNSTMFVAFTSSSLYLTWVLITVLTAGIDYFFYSSHLNFSLNTLNILLKERKIKGNINKYYDLPEYLNNYITKLKQFEV